MAIITEQLTTPIGAEIKGIALEDVIGDPALQDEVRAALWQHLVVGFRGQAIDDETHMAVARIFGEPQTHVIGQAMGVTYQVEEISDSSTKLPDRDGWHTDAPFLREPPGVAVLRGVMIPPSGGDTLWANMYAAYESMSATMQGFLQDLRVSYPPQQGLMDYVERHLGADVASRVRELLGDGSEHPLVRTHPETGRKALYFARDFAGSIVGLNDDESGAIWSLLQTRLANPSIQCRWRWQQGDVVIWDERATQHFGAADHRGQDRTLRRVLVAGDVPH